MSKKKIVGDPSPASPVSVEDNPDYQIMYDYQQGSWYPSAAEVIAKHKETNTFWRAVFRIREDDSDAAMSANWTQVFPKTKTIVEYDVKE